MILISKKRLIDVLGLQIFVYFNYFDSSMILFSAIYFCHIDKNRTANIAHF
jgi:hypothetical protein